MWVKSMSRETANKIYDVAVKHCGASENLRWDFVHYLLEQIADSPSWIAEFRFQGTLGFGGKLYIDPFHFKVKNYREDSTPERESAIDKANVELNLIFSEVSHGTDT